MPLARSTKLAVFGFSLLVGAIGVAESSAQSKCSSTLDCAQQAVDAAAKAGAKAQALEDRITKLETFQATIGNGRIIALIQVKHGTLQPTSSPKTSFDQSSGVVSFPNPRGLTFLPIISDANDAEYITSRDYIKSIIPPDKFVVRLNATDTSGRTFPPDNFTAVIVGFEAPSKP